MVHHFLGHGSQAVYRFLADCDDMVANLQQAFNFVNTTFTDLDLMVEDLLSKEKVFELGYREEITGSRQMAVAVIFWVDVEGSACLELRHAIGLMMH